MTENAKKITIQYSRSWQEYRVPAGPQGLADASIYYTSDRQDALDTARKIHGSDAEIKIRSVAE